MENNGGGLVSASSDHLHSVSPLNEKAASPHEKLSSTEIVNDKGTYLDSENPDPFVSDSVLVQGEPVVVDGKDVSRYMVDLRDDGDSPLTFRSVFLGTIFAGLGAALSQVYFYLYGRIKHITSPLLADLRLQASSNADFDCIYVASYLQFWHYLGYFFSSEVVDGRNPFPVLRTSASFHQSW
jgi:hypothetical protein